MPTETEKVYLRAARKPKRSITPQAPHTSMEKNDYQNQYGDGGVVIHRSGAQEDGGHGEQSFSSPEPPVPSAPVLTGGPGTFTAAYDGLYADPEVRRPSYYDFTDMLVSTDPAMAGATRGGSFVTAGSITYTTYTAGTYYIALVTESKAGVRSPMSTIVSVVVEETVTQAKLNAAVEKLEAADTALSTAEVELHRLAATDGSVIPEAVIDKLYADVVKQRISVATEAFIGGSAIIEGTIFTRHLTATEDIVGNLIRGTSFEGKTFSGGTFNGGVFQTDWMAERGIKLSGPDNTFSMWDPAGMRTLHADGDTGGLSLIGDFATGAPTDAGMTIRNEVDAEGATFARLFIRTGSTTETSSADIYAQSAGDLASDSMSLLFFSPQRSGYSTTTLQLFSEDADNSGAAYLGSVTGGALLEVGGNGRSSLFSPNGITLDAGTSNDGVLINGGRMQFGAPLAGYEGVFVQSDYPFRFSKSLSTEGQTVAMGWLDAETAVETPEVHSVGPLKLGGGGFIGLEINGDNLTSVTTYNRTTTASANMVIGTSSALSRSTSASRYKIDPQLMTLPDSLLDIEVKDWWDRSQVEAKAALADAPRPLTEAQSGELESLDDMGRVPGVIAEEVEGHGGAPFVSYADGLIESVSYDRLAMARTAVLKRQLDAIDRRLLALEAP